MPLPIKVIKRMQTTSCYGGKHAFVQGLVADFLRNCPKDAYTPMEIIKKLSAETDVLITTSGVYSALKRLVESNILNKKGSYYWHKGNKAGDSSESNS